MSWSSSDNLADFDGDKTVDFADKTVDYADRTVDVALGRNVDFVGYYSVDFFCYCRYSCLTISDPSGRLIYQFVFGRVWSGLVGFIASEVSKYQC